LRFLTTQYSLSTQSLDLYFAGCNGPHCSGCHNSETWDFEIGKEVSAKDLFNDLYPKFVLSSAVIKQIMLFGGEPLDQPLDELTVFISKVTSLNIPIWLFTRYELEDIPFSLRIKFNYIKTGRYLEEHKVNNYKMYGINLATSNQKISKRGVDY